MPTNKMLQGDSTPEEKTEDLIKHLRDEEAQEWGSRNKEALTATFAGKKALNEPILTGVFNRLDVESTRPVIGVFKQTVGADGDYKTDDPRKHAEAVVKNRRIIDTAIVPCVEGLDGLKKFFVEFKLTGYVNGRPGYCEVHGDVGYANQLSCYPDTCYIQVPRDERWMVWVGPKKYAYREPQDWGGSAITERDVRLYDYSPEFLDRQSIKNWDAFITHDELADAAMTGNLGSKLFGELYRTTIAIREL